MYWFKSCFAASSLDVFSRPAAFDKSLLPPFYSSLLLARESLGGSFSPSRGTLVFISSDPHVVASVASLSAKVGYQFLLSCSSVMPHRVVKFFPSFGNLYWYDTWRQFHFFDFDRFVVDFSWMVGHSVIYTPERLLSFGLSVSSSCFCGPVVESLSHLLFVCPLAQSVVGCLQSLLFHISIMCPVLERCHLLFGFNSAKLHAVPKVFIYLLCACKFQIWLASNDYHFRSVQPGAIAVIEGAKAHVKFHLSLLFKHFSTRRCWHYFARQWGADGVIPFIVSNKLVFRFGPPS